MLHGVPGCGTTAGQPGAGCSQNHCGGSIVWQTGNPVPIRQALQRHRVPSPYQQAVPVSEPGPWAPASADEHEVIGGGGIGHAAGRAGVLHAGSGLVTCQVPGPGTPLESRHEALVRQVGRGSFPQAQCVGGKLNVPPVHGGVHGEPGAGGLAGHAPTPESPFEPLLLPPDPLPEVLPELPELLLEVSGAPTVLAPHPAAKRTRTIDGPLAGTLMAVASER